MIKYILIKLYIIILYIYYTFFSHPIEVKQISEEKKNKYLEL